MCVYNAIKCRKKMKERRMMEQDGMNTQDGKQDGIPVGRGQGRPNGVLLGTVDSTRLHAPLGILLGLRLGLSNGEQLEVILGMQWVLVGEELDCAIGTLLDWEMEAQMEHMRIEMKVTSYEETMSKRSARLTQHSNQH